jgi:hypothetical protein
MTPSGKPNDDGGSYLERFSAEELGRALETLASIARNRLQPSEIEIIAEASRRLKGEPA